MKYTKWSEERAAQLGRLHAKDFSFGQIAAELGVSRGAVASKVVQMGLAGRPRGARLKPAVRVKSRGVVVLLPNGIVALSPDVPMLPGLDYVALLDLQPHHCRWPVRDTPYMFCADTQIDGSSYCEHHFGVSKRGVANP